MSYEIFDVSSMEEAKNIILTEEDLSTDVRWERETGPLADLIIEELSLTEASLVLDYGCGIGRLSKEIISKVGCTVVGADISPSMRALAASYVEDPKFISCAPEALSLFPQFDAAIAVWVLQHIIEIHQGLHNLYTALTPGGKLFVVNNIYRALPTPSRWVDDGIDISVEVERYFDTSSSPRKLPVEMTSERISEATFWNTYTRT